MLWVMALSKVVPARLPVSLAGGSGAMLGRSVGA